MRVTRLAGPLSIQRLEGDTIGIKHPRHRGRARNDP